jgi:hypothetical protein
MSKITKAGIAIFVCAVALGSTGTSALAWGCAAVSDEGTFGYSHSYETQDAAIERALNECARRTTSTSECEITECEDDS